MIDLRNNINKKEILGNEIKKVVNIAEKILDFNKKQKGNRLTSDLARVANVFDRKPIKILTPKQMLQRLPKALAQEKAGNTSENLINEIRQITYSLYREKEVTEKVCNNIMN